MDKNFVDTRGLGAEESSTEMLEEESSTEMLEAEESSTGMLGALGTEPPGTLSFVMD